MSENDRRSEITSNSLFPDNSLLIQKYKNSLMLNHPVIQEDRLTMVNIIVLTKDYFPVFSCLTGIFGEMNSH